MPQYENPKRDQRRTGSLILSFVFLLLVSLACNLPTSLPVANPFDSAEYVETSVIETLQVMELNQNPSETGTGLEGTPTPGENTSLTQTPGDPLSTPGDVKIYLSENTNCRIGQGSSFERVSILLQGEEAEVVGVDPSGSYWYIRLPDQPSDFCWLWAKYTTPTGPYESLPVFTPVPTATPGFEFAINFHSNLGFCGGFYVLQYTISNTGSVILESWRSSTTDHTGGSVPISNQQDKFIDNTGCAPVGERSSLSPGEAYYVNAMFTNDPAGHDITVAVQICSENGLGGSCISRTIRHTP